ncbi:RNA binding motif protein 12Ba [Mastacembelus armatus]|uniref:RNA binding motif protein 12Ba n=1 Tax=Mastacembelus armatus TaxID=205130 RepID=A0A3Q3LXC6_9TELE|nr:RNA-binding protein 12B-A-like [Mastacembelus armatus]XP_026172552.1 RNA-binding protein 12B-A-like [Mastacembelus armatus]XP_026172553.1 RNA-binding protein 12B-A-like [Mastacembelus armatus]XP_026172554.1 RNA-binding protein 12B-A-like [Mastacembelus armatus]
MTIILRLQGLDVKAGTEDIRKFFESLHIPDGGVYIVGGSLREAFIAFSTEKEAQLAMRHTGHFLKGSKVILHISSMAELEHKLESMLKKKPSSTYPTSKRPEPSLEVNLPSLKAGPRDPRTSDLPSTPPSAANLQMPALQTLDSNTAFLLGICTVLQGLQSSHQGKGDGMVLGGDFLKADSVVVSDKLKTTEITMNSKPGYVRLFGLPLSATKEDICIFFRGLTVQEVIVNVNLGLSHGCLVKFASMQEACDALRFNQQLLGSICVEVRGATEKMWISALQECESAFVNGENAKAQQNLLRETINHRQQSTSVLELKRQSVNLLLSKYPKKPRHDCDSAALSPTTEHIVMVSNLPKEMTKTRIKELFGCPNIEHKNVLHLLDKEGNRTDKAFLIFTRSEDYEYAVNLNGCYVGFSTVKVSSVTRQEMRDVMTNIHPKKPEHRLKRDTKKKRNQKRNLNPIETPEEAPGMKLDPAAQTCLFIRNLPAGVQKSQIKQLFCTYKLKDDDIILLHDADSNCIGKAVVQFKSQKLAALAHRLHGRDFMGTQVLLTCINVKQMEEMVAKNG